MAPGWAAHETSAVVAVMFPAVTLTGISQAGAVKVVNTPSADAEYAVHPDGH